MATSNRKTTYQRQLKGGDRTTKSDGPGLSRRRDALEKSKQRELGDNIDAKFGFSRFTETVADETGTEKSGMDLYFIDRNGENFKATVLCAPYFYLDVHDPKNIPELTQHLQKRFETCRLELVDLEDLDMRNHLSGKTHKFLQISFGTVAELMDCKAELRASITANKRSRDASSGDSSGETDTLYASGMSGTGVMGGDPLSFISDLREYDVPYTMRCSIDMNLRVGAWYVVTPEQGSEFCQVEWQRDFLELGEPRILAFDIECEKSPLKFPNADNDRIFMISYMVDREGFLIVNREVVSEDISDFEYSPMAKYPGPFRIFNVDNEEQLLRKFVSHVQELRPHVIVTYNGDFFDWPYVDSRCSNYALSLYKELGIRGSQGSAEGEYTGRCMVHLDAFAWVNRDSYLPQGNRGLKAVTRCKLGYDPVEVDPEDMLRFARERPEHMASYSVSDAVATYYLYTTYVHNFIFSLSTIIPMGPEDVLRKGSGTLCEALLMVEAYRGNIVCPNKEVDALESFYNGHLLESETYIGGHVECLEAGVFRADIATKFTLIPSALQALIDNVDRDLTFSLEVENGIQRSDVSNYDDVKQEIVMALEMLRDSPVREEMPMIYHLDVGAMYPNIILTNRLQPSAIVSRNDCAACDFNRAESNCKRDMKWAWRGDYSPANISEYNTVKRQLAYERVGDKLFSELSEKDQAALAKTRLKQYSQKAYNRTKITKTEERVNTVCMRENSFYVDTVRAFRDRRYDYKLLTKQWKGKKVAAEKAGDAMGKRAAEAKEVLMDSLQLAHKCILNSFYGYVMRKGARWRSMEMAGIVTHTGAELITQARILVEQVGRPLELDTDGIWCILPSSFPQEYKLQKKTGGSVHVDYPCAMLNADVHDRYTNHQYQDLQQQSSALSDGNGRRPTPRYSTHSECSIYFELDGPYKAMVLPASPEEGKLLKKKYAVFNFDNTIAELKGFELKRRGELELVKIFQSQVFDQFLEGTSLQESYDAVGRIGNQWLDVLDSQGANMDDDELLELISEKKTISKTLEDYEGRKATSLTTAERLSDFLGADMVKDKGLNCNLILSRLPAGAPVTERAIPVAIFAAEPAVRTFYLRKWLKSPSLDCDDFRNVVDWEYYKDRLGKTIQKIVTIPAGLQGVANPCPRVEHPVWVKRILQEKFSGLRQATISSMFGPRLAKPVPSVSPQKGKRSDLRQLLGTGSGGQTIVNVQGDALDFGGKKKRAHEDDVTVVDIEDISGAAREGVSSHAIAHFRSSRSPDTSGSTHREVHERVEPAVKTVKVMLTDKPTNMAEFDDWLEARKREWKQKREERLAMKNRLTHGGRGRDGQRQYGLTTSAVMAGVRDVAGQLDLDSQQKRPMRIDDLVRNAALAVTYGFWQIVELQETDSAGTFIAWVFTGQTQLQRLYLAVPRILFVNCRAGGRAEATALQLGGKLVKRELPHDRVMHNLYEIHLPEHKYIRNEKALGLFLCDPQVEGVYETKTPVWFRALTRLSCVTSLADTAALEGKDGTSVATAFKLKDIKFVNVGTHKYLESDVATFKQIFLYHTMDASRNNVGIVGLFVISESNSVPVDEEGGSGSGIAFFTAKSYVWIVQPRGTLAERPPLQRIFRRFCPNELSTCKFTFSTVSALADAWMGCNEVLAEYVRQRKGPTLVIAQGSGDARSWRRGVPRLHEFPLVTMPCNSRDDAFPPIGWQIRICNIMIQRFLLFPEWFEDRLDCARYARVPVANLGRDVNMTMTDVLFARQLEHNRHLLWAAAGPLPDIGGAENDQHSVWSDSMEEQKLSEPGAYRCMCVELEVFGLAVAAIMGSGMLDAQGITAIAVSSSATGGQEQQEEDIGSSGLSHDAACARAFNLLKGSVTKWLHDALVGDLHADALLQGLYRFLCGRGQTLMHDPVLYRVVYILMTKLFARLVSEFRRLGSTIIYADFYRIIIATNRYDYDSAKEYVDFVVSAVLDRELFQQLQINTKCMWEQLLWLDSANWGGVRYRQPDESVTVEPALVPDGDDDMVVMMENSQHGHIYPAASDKSQRLETLRETADDDEWIDSEGDDEEVDGRERGRAVENPGRRGEYDFLDEVNELARNEVADIHDTVVEEYSNPGFDVEPETRGDTQHSLVEGYWDLVTLLPPAAGVYLRHAIDQFMLVYREQWQLAVESVQEPWQGEQLTSVEYEECVESVNRYMQNLIRHRLGAQLLQTVDILLHTYAGPTVSSTGGSSISANHADALNFVKFTTKLLSLDSALANEVAGLRRTLLTQLSMKEFNALSEFADPSLSYVMLDIICSYCNICRDMDLLRDPVLTGKNRMQGDEGGRAPLSGWFCTNCGNGYDVAGVEQRLLEDVERIVTTFLLQDFRCSKTLAVSTRLCSSTSDLCASLKLDWPEEKVMAQLNVFLEVAKVHRFAWLEETVREYLADSKHEV